MTSALQGLCVIDLSRYIAGPLCGQMLADFGAEVIKVESPKGEESRDTPPLSEGYSLYYASYNRNKKAITLNLRAEEGRNIFLDLIRKADIVVHNFRPKVLQDARITYELLKEINPQLIMISISGFGKSGAWAHWPAYDDVGQAMSGLMDLTGDPEGPPTLVGTFIVDHLTALNATIGGLAAVHERTRTGKGQEVEVALVDCGTASLMHYLAWAKAEPSKVSRMGNRNRFYAASNTYPTEDGYIHITATRDRMWRRLAEAIGKLELAAAAGYATWQERWSRIDEIDDHIAEWTKQRSTSDAVRSLAEAGVPCAPVLSAGEVVESNYVASRSMLVEVESEDNKVISVAGNPIRLNGEAVKVYRNPPPIGGDNDEVYGGMLGIDAERMEKLSKEGVI